MRLTQKRNGKNVIPLLMAVCGINLPYWRIDKADDLHSYLSGDAVDKLAAYEDAEEQGMLVRHDKSMALAMLAGARAIEQNSRKYFGTTFVHDPFGCSKEISYYEAANKLRAEAEAALKAEAKLLEGESRE